MSAATGRLARGEGTAPAARVPGVAKSEETRTLILNTALTLFAEHGYHRTTMRAIAAEAGVSVGNAYYYFAAKEHLIQGFYDRVAELHTGAVGEVLATERDFAGRLSGVLLAWVDVAEPYHEFGRQFFGNAADPDSPLSPFSAESAPARDSAIAIFRRVVATDGLTADPELLAELPRLLWLYLMGVVLFWVYDRSPGQQRTRVLIERSVPLINRVVGMSRSRLLRPATRELVSIIKHVTEPTPPAVTPTTSPSSSQ